MSLLKALNAKLKIAIGYDLEKKKIKTDNELNAFKYGSWESY